MSYNGILVEIGRSLLKHDWIIEMNHIYREANKIISQLGAEKIYGRTLPVPPPKALAIHLQADALGVAFTRMIYLAPVT